MPIHDTILMDFGNILSERKLTKKYISYDSIYRKWPELTNMWRQNVNEPCLRKRKYINIAREQ